MELYHPGNWKSTEAKAQYLTLANFTDWTIILVSAGIKYPIIETVSTCLCDSTRAKEIGSQPTFFNQSEKLFVYQSFADTGLADMSMEGRDLEGEHN